MALALSTGSRDNMMTQILNALDAGAGAAKVRIYDGTRPATGGAVTTLLAELVMTDPAGSVASQVLTLSAIADDASADATGTATWFRLVDSVNAFVADGDVALSGAELNFDDITFTAGQVIKISSFTFTAGNA